PDHARRRPEEAPRGLRLSARARTAGRHVPAHAARRDRRHAGTLSRHAFTSVSETSPRGLRRRGWRRSRRQSRSAFGARKASESSGSAGRPPTSCQIASAIVAPKESERASHVRRTRSPKRAAAARNRAKKNRSGRPRWVAPSGTGNVTENAENTVWWWLTIDFVGPRQTEYASTQGTTNATRTTHETSSNSHRNAHARNVIAPSFAKVASTTASATNASPIAAPIAIGKRASGSRRSANAHTAGITATESHAISHQRLAVGSSSTTP